MASPFEVKLELRKGGNKMVAPIVPLVIAGVRIAAPIAAKYLAGKITKKAALKATEKGTKLAQKGYQKFVGPKLLSKTAKKDLEKATRVAARYKDKAAGKLTKTEKLKLQQAKNRELKTEYGTSNPEIIKRMNEGRKLNALEKARFEERMKKAGPFNSGNKSQAAWGGYGPTPKGIYKAGGSVKIKKASGLNYKKGGMVKKCRMDGIALRGKTRAKERGK